MSNRNRSVGHSWERDTVKLLREIFPNIATSRACNRLRDSQKVDLVNADESVHGRLPYNFQCKCLTGNVDLEKLLKELPVIPQITNVILHRKTKKIVTKSKKAIFKVTGEYVYMDFEAFVNILRTLKTLQDEVNSYRC
jgi:hypothetical protein